MKKISKKEIIQKVLKGFLSKNFAETPFFGRQNPIESGDVLLFWPKSNLTVSESGNPKSEDRLRSPERIYENLSVN